MKIEGFSRTVLTPDKLLKLEAQTTPSLGRGSLVFLSCVLLGGPNAHLPSPRKDLLELRAHFSKRGMRSPESAPLLIFWFYLDFSGHKTMVLAN